MEVRKLPPTPVHSREFRSVRIDGQSVQPRSPAAAHSARPQEHAQNLETRSEFAEDHRSAARARKAKRRLRRLFEQAIRNAKGRARLCRADEYEIVRCAYRAVRTWQRDGVHEEIERELRAEAEVAVSRRSSLFLLLIRCSLPRLEIKRASKWAAALEYADRQEVKSKRLPGFLWRVGGVEGAARAKAMLGRESSERSLSHAHSRNAVKPR
jgi:hypothetical protein